MMRISKIILKNVQEESENFLKDNASFIEY